MRRTAALAALTFATLFVAGCAGKSEPAASTPPSPSPASSSPSPAASASPTTAPSPTAPAVDQTIRITYAGGKVSGASSLVKVKLNSRVALVITSDVADEVHLHTYDKSADVAKGGTATITFKATIPGRIEVELEKLKRRLVVLQIQ
jgi:copper(I)-binding protein